MVKFLTRAISCFVMLFLVACRSFVLTPTPTPTPTRGITEIDPQATPGTNLDFGWQNRTPFRGGLIHSEQSVLDELAGASVYHIDLQIAADLVHLDGHQDVLYTNLETEPLDDIYFRLFPNLLGGMTQIHALRVNDHDTTPTFELLDSAMRVPLSPALQPGQQVAIKIAFSVLLPDRETDKSYGMLIFADDILALAHFYPVIAVYDDEGWNMEIPSENGDLLYADTSFYIVRVTAPDKLTITASGIEIEREKLDSQQQVTYAGGPMRDFFLAASSRYSMISEQVGETMVNSYALSEFTAGAEATLGYAVDALKVFEDRFGPYPFTEFDIVSSPTLALGIEYPGIVVIALNLYDLENGKRSPTYLESTVAHEVGHQWFYGVVGNDQLDEPWVDEALTQYATLLYWQDLYGASGADGFRDSLYGRWDRVERAEIPIGRPVKAYSGAEYSAIVYGRGPLFFDVLSEKMGQKTFDTFLRDYYKSHQWSIATTASLKQLAEKHCNCDLNQLFASWVYE